MNELKNILKWILGIGCVIFSLMSISTSIIAAILFLTTFTFLIPPIFNRINENGKIGRTVKILVPILSFFAAFIVLGIQSVGDEKKIMVNTDVEKVREYSNLSKEQKDSIAHRAKINDSLKNLERQKEAEINQKQKVEAQKKNSISARQLYSTYEANEVSADDSFKNRTFYVAGTVDAISKDFLENIYVTLRTSEYLSSVQCFIDDREQTAKLKKGQKVTLYGKCKGLTLLNVIMEDCELVDNLN